MLHHRSLLVAQLLLVSAITVAVAWCPWLVKAILFDRYVAALLPCVFLGLAFFWGIAAYFLLEKRTTTTVDDRDDDEQAAKFALLSSMTTTIPKKAHRKKKQHNAVVCLCGCHGLFTLGLLGMTAWAGAHIMMMSSSNDDDARTVTIGQYSLTATALCVAVASSLFLILHNHEDGTNKKKLTIFIVTLGLGGTTIMGLNEIGDWDWRPFQTLAVGCLLVAYVVVGVHDDDKKHHTNDANNTSSMQRLLRIWLFLPIELVRTLYDGLLPSS